MQDRTYEGACSELVEDIVENLPLSGETLWWSEVRPPKKGPDTPAARARANATLATSKSMSRRGSTSSSRGTRPLATEEVEILSDCAMQAWEFLRDCPAVQERVVKAMQDAGARVKVENDTIIKTERPSEDDF